MIIVRILFFPNLKSQKIFSVSYQANIHLPSLRHEYQPRSTKRVTVSPDHCVRDNIAIVGLQI